MPCKVAILSAAHVHAPSYAHCFHTLEEADLACVWDNDHQRGAEFAKVHDVEFTGDLDQAIADADAVVITSENSRHEELALEAMGKGRHVLCEKPLSTSVAAGEGMIAAAKSNGVVLMTAFPCPFSPAFIKAAAKLQAGELGDLVAIAATNRGTCPGSWFVEEELSGGGAMIDHVVHVADLLRRLIGSDPIKVHASAGNKLYGQSWEDTAMLTLEYGDGVFVSLDSSWSRPKSYKTWGDVTLNIVGTLGVIELDLFNQQLDTYSPNHRTAGFGSNLDMAMCREFLAAIRENREPLTSGEDGLAAAKVALAGYRSVAQAEAVGV